MSKKIIRRKQNLNKIATSLTNEKKKKAKPKKKATPKKKKKSPGVLDRALKNWSSGMRSIGKMWD